MYWNWKLVTLSSIALIGLSMNGRGFADEPKYDTATFGGGCYWCTEAVFEDLDGVKSVKPGFMGGRARNPTYQQVLTGRTGHAEVVHIKFDPKVVSYDSLLQIFWEFHDPTTLNRQGPDFGTQYRSVVFYHSDEQRKTAIDYKRQLTRDKVFRKPIVTKIDRAGTFYPTDADHDNYFERNPDKAYCVHNIVPKMKKLKEKYADKLKPDAE